MNAQQEIKYDFRVKLLSEDEGGGYLIQVPQLPGCMAVGQTLKETIEKLPDAIDTWLGEAKRLGRKVPQPQYMHRRHEYSGKLSLRMPKSLHEEIAILASEQDVSINQMIIYLLARGVGSELNSEYKVRPAAAVHENRSVLKRPD